MKALEHRNSKDAQILVFTLLIIFLLVIQIASRSENVTTASLSFRVVESDNETPVSNVRIRLSRMSKVIYQTTSDEKGVFTLPALETSDLTIELTAQGYVSERLVGQKPANTARVIRLFHEGVLQGKVATKKTNKPIPGARLNLWGPRGHLQTLTDSEGKFYASQLQSGKYTIALQVDGYPPRPSEQIEIHGGQTITKDFVFTEGSLFTGVLKDRETDKPLKNIYIYLQGNFYYSDYTDEKGFFSFANVEPGKYQVTVYHEGFKQLRSETVEIGENELAINRLYYLEPLDPQFEIYTHQQVF